MSARTFKLAVLAASLTLMLAPMAHVARAEAPTTLPISGLTALLAPFVKGGAASLLAPAAEVYAPGAPSPRTPIESALPAGPAATPVPTNAPLPTVAPTAVPTAAPTAKPPIDIPAGVSAQIRAQTQSKIKLQDQLRASSSAATAREGEPVDTSQASVADPLARGILKLAPGTVTAFAYVQPYREPDVWAYRNYCGAGATIALLSHWDTTLPSRADIGLIGSEIGIDPNGGCWIYQITNPVNQHVNSYLGRALNWYRYGNAQSITDFRWIINYDIAQNGVPFITGVMTGGLPGWGSMNVGHIICVYGYSRTPQGVEYVSYADTAQPASGYSGKNLHVWEINSFWEAAGPNSAQVW
jgi:hypothetical protein